MKCSKCGGANCHYHGKRKRSVIDIGGERRQVQAMNYCCEDCGKFTTVCAEILSCRYSRKIVKAGMALKKIYDKRHFYKIHHAADELHQKTGVKVCPTTLWDWWRRYDRVKL